MSGASSSRATELEVSSEEVDGGLTLPRVSSARQRYVSVRMGQRTNNRLGSKSQPEINRRKDPRIASKLCSTVSIITAMQNARYSSSYICIINNDIGWIYCTEFRSILANCLNNTLNISHFSYTDASTQCYRGVWAVQCTKELPFPGVQRSARSSPQILLLQVADEG